MTRANGADVGHEKEGTTLSGLACSTRRDPHARRIGPGRVPAARRRRGDGALELPGRPRALLEEILGSVFPIDQVAVVNGDASVGATFSALPFDHLIFTGSTAVGRKVMQAGPASI